MLGIPARSQRLLQQPPLSPPEDKIRRVRCVVLISTLQTKGLANKIADLQLCAAILQMILSLGANTIANTIGKYGIALHTPTHDRYASHTHAYRLARHATCSRVQTCPNVKDRAACSAVRSRTITVPHMLLKRIHTPVPVVWSSFTARTSLPPPTRSAACASSTSPPGDAA